MNGNLFSIWRDLLKKDPIPNFTSICRWHIALHMRTWIPNGVMFLVNKYPLQRQLTPPPFCLLYPATSLWQPGAGGLTWQWWHLPRSAVARVGSLFPRLTDEWANGQIEDFAAAAAAVCLSEDSRLWSCREKLTPRPHRAFIKYDYRGCSIYHPPSEWISEIKRSSPFL